ncbi:MAG: ATP-binding protein [Candidatus Eisenbacteria bacterium]
MSIIDALPTAVLMVDETGRIVLANSAAEPIFRYSREEMLGLSVEDLVPQRYRPHHAGMRAGFKVEPTTRLMGAGRDLWARRKDGTEFPVEIGLNPVQTESGFFVVAAVLDIEERKRAEAHLVRMNEALERSNLDLQQFAYIASHDLQSPLRGISGYAQILQMQYGNVLDDQANEHITKIVDTAKWMQNLVQDLLAFSRVDSRARPFAAVDCGEVLRDVVEYLRPSIEDAKATVSWDELPTVEGDRSQLVELFQNLVGNAIKYHGETLPVVRIDARREGDSWLFSVSDNGIGIAPEHTDRIFTIFSRLHTQKAFPGTGIGLAVCRRVAHRHGGTIWVESELGKGSTFYFDVPDRVTEESNGSGPDERGPNE